MAYTVQTAMFLAVDRFLGSRRDLVMSHPSLLVAGSGVVTVKAGITVSGATDGMM